MTKKDFKQLLFANGINIFYFCTINSYDHNDLSLLKDDEHVSKTLSENLNEYIKKINEIEDIFFDVAKSEGLRSRDDKVEFHLEGKNKDVNLNFDSSMINRINFIM